METLLVYPPNKKRRGRIERAELVIELTPPLLLVVIGPRWLPMPRSGWKAYQAPLVRTKPRSLAKSRRSLSRESPRRIYMMSNSGLRSPHRPRVGPPQEI